MIVWPHKQPSNFASAEAMGGTCKMSETTLNNIRNLFESIGQHSAIVEERMREAGMAPDPVVAESLAKYWDALEKLAAE